MLALLVDTDHAKLYEVEIAAAVPRRHRTVRVLRDIPRQPGDTDSLFFEDIARALRIAHPEQGIVMFVNGAGKAGIASALVETLLNRHSPLAHHIESVERIDVPVA